MSRCRICSHPERGRIELLGVSGASHVVLARQFKVSRYSVDRHLARHVSQERRAQLVAGPLKLHELAEKAAEAGLSLLDYLQLVRGSLTHLFLAAGEAGDRNGAASLAGRLVQVLRLQAELTGEIVKAPFLQINNSQTNVTALLDCREFVAFQATLIRVLGHFPDARAAVVAEFERLERVAVPAALPAAQLVPIAGPAHAD